MISATEIGTRLRRLRGDRTIEKVSEDTGLGRSALTMYELGNRIPRDEAKLILADYYNVSVDRLFFAQTFTIRE